MALIVVMPELQWAVMWHTQADGDDWVVFQGENVDVGLLELPVLA